MCALVGWLRETLNKPCCRPCLIVRHCPAHHCSAHAKSTQYEHVQPSADAPRLSCRPAAPAADPAAAHRPFADTVDGGTSTAPAAPTFSVPVIQEAVKLAIAPAVQAAVQEALAAAVAQGGTSGGGGGSQGGSATAAAGTEAVAAALLVSGTFQVRLKIM